MRLPAVLRVTTRSGPATKIASVGGTGATNGGAGNTAGVSNNNGGTNANAGNGSSDSGSSGASSQAGTGTSGANFKRVIRPARVRLEVPLMEAAQTAATAILAATMEISAAMDPAADHQ